jgi:hypothetical protein
MKYLIMFLILLLSSKSFSEDSISNPIDSETKSFSDTIKFNADPEFTDVSLQFISKKEFWLAISTLIVLLITLTLILKLISKKNLNDDLAVKLILTIIVIISTLFLVTAGYDDKSIAPAFGLFGAVLGYIFGKSDTKNQEK